MFEKWNALSGLWSYKKKKEEEVAPVRLRNKLLIRDTQGVVHTATVEDWYEGEDFLSPWQEFFVWYMTSDTPAFRLVMDDSCLLLVRAHIASALVKVEEVT